MIPKLSGFEEGDTIEVSFRAVIGCINTSMVEVTMDGADDTNTLWGEAFNSPHFSIKKVEPPIAVGDRVVWGRLPETFEVAAFNGDQAALWDGRRFISADAETLSRA